MAGSFSLPTVLANLAAGNEALSLIDGDFTACYNPLVALNSFSNYYADTGAANTYVVTVSSPQTVAQTAGLAIQFLATNANTGASTLQINALAVKNITHLDGSALVAGDIPAAGLVSVIYDGTQYQLQSKGKASALDGVTSLTGVAGTNTITATAAPTFAAYATGQKFAFVPAATNTAATTLNIGGLGAKNIFWNAAACNGGEIRSGVPCIVFYDGTQFNLISQGGALNSIAAGAVGGPGFTFSSDTTTGLYRPGANIVAMSISGTQAWQTTAAGFFKASNSGTYQSATGTFHELVRTIDDAAGAVLHVRNTAATATNEYGIQVTLTGDPNDVTRYFFTGVGNVTTRINIMSNGNLQNTNNSYGAISDRKLKSNIVVAGSQWDDVKALGVLVSKFSFNDDPEKRRLLGFVAQDIEAVSPGLVYETDDFETIHSKDDKGNPTIERRPLGTKTKGVNYSIAYMKAFKALAECLERVEILEAKLAGMRGG